MKRPLLTLLVVVGAAGCKPSAPPDNLLATQRAVMQQASELGAQLQQQSDQRMKSLDETK